MTSYFPRFIEEEPNEDLEDEVSKGELKSLLEYFKKGKCASPNGCRVEFYLVFYD
jgi:hypothetical protein